MDEDGIRLPTGAGGAFIYDPYGAEVSGASEGGYPYRYTGRRYDVQTGLYYYRARYYDADIGRFLQTDPIGTADQMNLYGYVGNNPLNMVDRNGLWAVKVGFELQGSVAGIGGGGTGMIAISYDKNRPINAYSGDIYGQVKGHLNRFDIGVGGGGITSGGLVAMAADIKNVNLSSFLMTLLDSGIAGTLEGGFYKGKNGHSATVEDLAGFSVVMGAGRYGTGAAQDGIESLKKGDKKAITKAIGTGIKASPIPGSLQVVDSNNVIGVDVGFGPTVGLTSDINVTGMLSTEDLRKYED